MCLAMENKEKRDKITGMITGMRLMGASEGMIIEKITDVFHVTKDYVMDLLKPQGDLN